MIEWEIVDGFVALRTQVWLPQPRGRVFEFFADARNLERITPPWLGFRILTRQPIAMRKGARIDSRISLHGLPLRWRSEITEWNPPQRFVDEQLRGPYRAWIHEHDFAELDGGTDVRDRVRYSVLGGRLVDRLIVRRDVHKIFAYRAAKLRELFRDQGSTTR